MIKKITNSKVYVLIFCAFILLVPFIWFYLLSPKSKIESLNKGYVEVKNIQNEVAYHFVAKAPKSWTFLKNLKEKAYMAVVISEDWSFFEHPGVDFDQLLIAIKDTSEGKRLRGASTIHQQVIKNLFYSNERSLLRKLKEVPLAMHMDKVLKKKKIIEVYLNIIEYGEGVFGIDQAAKHYFNKRPSQLNIKEFAFLAMLLPNPKKYSSSFEEKKLSNFAKDTINKILKKLLIAKVINQAEYNRELERILWNTKRTKDKLTKLRDQKAKRRMKKAIDYEQQYRNDKDLELNDDLTYDDDAIIEDTSGLKEEFSVE